MVNLLQSLYQSTVIMAAPLILVSLGGLMSYHAGIVNVALEGLILAAAFMAVVFSYLFSSALMGIFGAVIVAVLFSVLYSFFVTTLKTNNFAIGFALNIFISSFTLYLTRIMFVGQNAFNSPDIKAIPNLSINFGAKFPNSIFSNFSILVYAAVILTFIISYAVFKTPFGMWLRAAGSFPAALTAAGIKVSVIQYAASILTGILCGLAGAQLSLSNVVMFSRDMSSGRGFICLAAILISKGRPKIAFLISILFGLFEALSIQLQAFSIPPQFLFMLPYIMAICAIAIMNTGSRYNKHDFRRQD